MELPILAHALDDLSWTNLQERYPILAEAIRAEVDKGRTPDEIRRFIMRYSGATGLADWCAASARGHLAEKAEA